MTLPRVFELDRALFRGGLVCKAHRWLYHSTLGSRVIKKKKKKFRGYPPPRLRGASSLVRARLDRTRPDRPAQGSIRLRDGSSLVRRQPKKVSLLASQGFRVYPSPRLRDGSSLVRRALGRRGARRARTTWSRGGLVFKAQRLLYHSTLGLIKEKKRPVRYRGTSLIRNRPPPLGPP